MTARQRCLVVAKEMNGPFDEEQFSLAYTERYGVKFALGSWSIGEFLKILPGCEDQASALLDLNCPLRSDPETRPRQGIRVTEEGMFLYGSEVKTDESSEDDDDEDEGESSPEKAGGSTALLSKATVRKSCLEVAMLLTAPFDVKKFSMTYKERYGRRFSFGNWTIANFLKTLPEIGIDGQGMFFCRRLDDETEREAEDYGGNEINRMAKQRQYREKLSISGELEDRKEEIDRLKEKLAAAWDKAGIEKTKKQLSQERRKQNDLVRMVRLVMRIYQRTEKGRLFKCVDFDNEWAKIHGGRFPVHNFGYTNLPDFFCSFLQFFRMKNGEFKVLGDLNPNWVRSFETDEDDGELELKEAGRETEPELGDEEGVMNVLKPSATKETNDERKDVKKKTRKRLPVMITLDDEDDEEVPEKRAKEEFETRLVDDDEVVSRVTIAGGRSGDQMVQQAVVNQETVWSKSAMTGVERNEVPSAEAAEVPVPPQGPSDHPPAPFFPMQPPFFFPPQPVVFPTKNENIGRLLSSLLDDADRKNINVDDLVMKTIQDIMARLA